MIFLFEKKIHLRPLPDTPCLCKLKLRQFKLLRTVFDYFEIANYFWEFTEESGYFQWKKLRLRYWEISNVLVENTENVWHERLLRILFINWEENWDSFDNWENWWHYWDMFCVLVENTEKKPRVLCKNWESHDWNTEKWLRILSKT